MASLTILDAASRGKPMAKRNWIKKAVGNNRGVFKKKAQAAGETTREFASQHSGDKGKLGAEARLATNLMSMSRRSKLYDHKKD